MKKLECFNQKELLSILKAMGFEIKRKTTYHFHCKLNQLVVCVYITTGAVSFQGKGAEKVKNKLIEAIDKINEDIVNTA